LLEGAGAQPRREVHDVTLLHASDLALAYGSRAIFDGLTLTIAEGERVGLVGVNGSGKSSVMRILARAAAPDRGEVQLRRGATVTYLPQEPEFPPGATVASELEVARAPLRAALDAHATLAARLAAERDEAAHARLLDELAVQRVLGGLARLHLAAR
jgi:ATP-binding cassette subfamily F protein uup